MPRRSWSKRRSPITGDLTVIAVPSGLGAGDPKPRTPLTILSPPDCFSVGTVRT